MDFQTPGFRFQHQPFVAGVRVQLREPAPGHLAYGVIAGAEGTVHAGPADAGTGLVRVRFDCGREFWCTPESLEPVCAHDWSRYKLGLPKIGGVGQTCRKCGLNQEFY